MSRTQEGDDRPCHTMTGVSVSTVEVPEGHFTCLTLSRPDLSFGALINMDHDEVAHVIMVLQNAVEDARLLDAGQPPVHTVGLGATRRH